MAALLSELALDYEILADDPIEKGIHFGQSVLSHVTETISQVSEMAGRAAANVLHYPEVVEQAPIGQPITLAGRAVKPRTSLGPEQIIPRPNSVNYQRRKTVNVGLRPIQGRGAVDYRPRRYAKRSSFLVSG